MREKWVGLQVRTWGASDLAPPRRANEESHSRIFLTLFFKKNTNIEYIDM